MKAFRNSDRKGESERETLRFWNACTDVIERGHLIGMLEAFLARYIFIELSNSEII